jgi:hypothetical protein
VAIAGRAAGAQGRFESCDLTRCALPDAETILLIDVLHYLPRPEQDALLARACSAVRLGGRLVVRELDPSRGLRSKVGMLAERIAARTRYNRGIALEFRPIPEIIAELEGHGLACRVVDGPGSPVPNVMIVGELRDRAR